MEKLGIIGLGYVGLPLALEFAKKTKVVGFDLNQNRIQELRDGYDRTHEVTRDYLKSIKSIDFSADETDLADCSVYIVTVPTPIDEFKKPDLSPLIKASQMLSKVISKDDIVIYESTVYPGCTEEVCVPELEQGSGLKYNTDFYCGYSPERINPGDKTHTVTKIKKVTSGSTPEIAEKVDQLYKSIIVAGTHKASSIKVAEAAKVIENAQRDLNIAFVNELALIFDKVGIDTEEVLEAAGTKWNFLPFRPGLVGGHCIGVDPYYLTYKAESLGYHPQVILSGRRINDDMGKFVANRVIKLMAKNGGNILNAKVLVMGVTFKENCPDIRNSRVIDVINELISFGCNVSVYDPLANKEEVKHEYGFDLIDKPAKNYQALVLATAHTEFKQVDPRALVAENGIVFDVKNFFPLNKVDGRL